MAIAAFNPPPGMFNDGTAYSYKGVWFSGDKVRFRGGFPEKIGGWTKLNPVAFDGVCRCLYQWTDLLSVQHIAAGTHTKLYIEDSGSVFYDRTPLRPATLPNNPLATSSGTPTLTVTHVAHGRSVGGTVIIQGAVDIGGFTAAQVNGAWTIAATPTADTYTVTLASNAGSSVSGGGSSVGVSYGTAFTVPLANNPFSTTDTLAVVSVTHVNHGASTGDYVTFSGASAAGGITISGEYAVTAVTSSSVYTITHTAPATSTATGGGAAVRAAYQLPIGAVNFSRSLGWGSGGWGLGGWGDGSLTSFGDQMRLWSMANFGENLVANPRGGSIYYYEAQGTARAIDIRLLPGSNSAPAQANYIIVTPEDRRVVAFGCTDPYTGIFDPLLIRWCDNEDIANWDPDDEAATAGFLRLSSGSEILSAMSARGEILVWTESSLSVMRFVEDLIFGVTLASPNIDILGPNSIVSADDSMYWMGKENFFSYNGRAMTMPCSVRQYVFGNINLDQAYKVVGFSNRLFREVTWCYPSAGQLLNDRYVTFNYSENVWYFGTIDRTAWSDAGISRYPIAAADDGHVYYHEIGLDDGSTTPPSAIEAYVESSPIELDEGERFSFVSRVIPDVSFSESSATNPSVTYELTPSNWPGGAPKTSDTGTTTRTAVLPVEQWTEKMDVRLRGRQFKLRVSSEDLGVAWRLGKQRFDVRPDGKK